jgi:hypothetical protein
MRKLQFYQFQFEQFQEDLFLQEGEGLLAVELVLVWYILCYQELVEFLDQDLN